MRRAAKTDKNQTQLVKQMRKIGMSVYVTSGVGNMKNECLTETEFIVPEGKARLIKDRNIQILQLLSEDKRPEQIASILFVSVQLVRLAIHHMLKSNNIKSTTGLIASAIRHNII